LIESSLLGSYANTFSTTLTFTGNPGPICNVSNDTFSLTIPEGLITITVTLQQDSTGQTEPISGTFTPFSHVTSPGSMALSAALHIDAGIVGSSEVVLPLSISSVISIPTDVFRGQALDANGSITLVGQANAVVEPLDSDLVQANLVVTLVIAPLA
jgi:hypothetical protein